MKLTATLIGRMIAIIFVSQMLWQASLSLISTSVLAVNPGRQNQNLIPRNIEDYFELFECIPNDSLTGEIFVGAPNTDTSGAIQVQYLSIRLILMTTTKPWSGSTNEEQSPS